jgi:hypothetical protein
MRRYITTAFSLLFNVIALSYQYGFTLTAHEQSQILTPCTLSYHMPYHTVTLHIKQLVCAYVAIALLRLMVAVAVCKLYCSQRSKRYNKKVSRKLQKLRSGRVNPAITRIIPDLTAVSVWLQQVC